VGMTDREAAIARLLRIADREQAWMEEIGLPDASSIGAFLREVAEMLREQEPRVLTMSEVKHIGADNHSTLKNDGLTVMWLEEFGKQYPLHVVILKWDEDDWSGNPNDIVDVYYFGTDEYDRLGLTDYNLTWRCWTDKPTEMQRMGAAWDAAD